MKQISTLFVSVILLSACVSVPAHQAEPNSTPAPVGNAKVKIKDLVVGTGTKAGEGTLVTCQYTGYLENGTKFDSSYDHGKPFQFILGGGRVIQGWDDGIRGMKVGGKRHLFVPAALAYGDHQMGPLITPNSNLIFDIELVDAQNRK